MIGSSAEVRQQWWPNKLGTDTEAHFRQNKKVLNIQLSCHFLKQILLEIYTETSVLNNDLLRETSVLTGISMSRCCLSCGPIKVVVENQCCKSVKWTTMWGETFPSSAAMITVWQKEPRGHGWARQADRMNVGTSVYTCTDKTHAAIPLWLEKQQNN